MLANNFATSAELLTIGSRWVRVHLLKLRLLDKYRMSRRAAKKPFLSKKASRTD